MSIDKKKIGKASRAAGKRFELVVRADLERQKFVVTKWANQVDFKNNKLIPAKSQYNPFLKRIIGEGSGFPDYFIYRPGKYVPFGVECKLGKYLDAEEWKKVKWLLDNKIFRKMFVAYKKKRGKVSYAKLEDGKYIDV